MRTIDNIGKSRVFLTAILMSIAAQASAEDAKKIPTSLKEKSAAEIGALIATTPPGQVTNDAVGELNSRANTGDATALRMLGDIYREGRLRDKDLKKALSLYEQAIEKGDKSVFTKIGDIYYRSGATIGLEPAIAVKFYERGVDNKDPWAIAGLGDVYREGKVVSRDLSKALALYTEAMHLGNSAVFAKLGDIYYRDGADLGLNPSTAIDFYQKGVDKQDRWAMASLGDVYREGKIVVRDAQKALTFYEQALKLGNNDVFTKMGDTYRNGAEAGLDPTKAIEFYQKGIERGDARAIASLGDVYREGKIVQKDPAKALVLYDQAAALGNAAVFAKIGDLYYRNASDLNVDSAKATEFYQKGIDAGDSWAMVGLGDAYRDGQIVPKDLTKALSLYEQAASLGNASVATKIGEIYYRNGVELKLDPVKAVEFFQKGADRGDTWAMMGLGDVYREGKVVSQAPEKARSYYEEALKAGNNRAYAAIVNLLLKGTQAEQKRGLVMIKEGLGDKVPGLTPIWADAYIYGRGVTANPLRGLQILKDAVDAGDLPATLRLIQIHAEGYNNSIPKNPKLAIAMLNGLVDKMTPDRFATERLYVLGTSAQSREQMKVFVAGLDSLPPPNQATVIGRIAWRNENAFVYALQTLMAESGLYTGQINGMLTSSTIAGLYRECLKYADDSVCANGPLSRQVRPILSNLFRTRPQS